MRYTIIFLVFIGLICSCKEEIEPIDLHDGRWVDLSHDFDENTIYWPTADEFKLETVSEGMTPAGYYYSAYSFCMAEHGGTHLDAPVHFAEGQRSVEQIPLEQLVAPAVVIDVSEKAMKDPDYQVNIEDFESWEKKYGMIPGESIILLKTGYGQYWPDKVKYLGTSERGPDAVALLHFPGLHPDAARWLTENRKIKAIGLDTPSIDFGQSGLFESHRILFRENIPAFENVAKLEDLPVTGAWVIALPIKIKGGSGGPLRIVGFVPS